MEQKNQKKILAFEIIAFEPGSTYSHNPEQDTCHWQSICYETTLRFNISLRDVDPKERSLRVMKNIMKFSHAYFKSGWNPLTCWLSKCVVKRCFLGSGQTQFLTVCTFQNRAAVTMIVFSKCSKFNAVSRKAVSHILKQDTYYWQSICYQATLTFNMSLRELYSKRGSLRVMKSIMKVL